MYLTSTNKSIGALLAQDVEGAKKSIYYISCISRGPEVRYIAMERNCLALIFAAKKFRDYMLAFPIQIITK